MRHHSLAVLLLLVWPTFWMRTPPPPSRSAGAHATELDSRRAAVLASLGPRDALVLFAAQARDISGEVDYPYRQENNFWYLTGINQPGGILVLSPAAKPQVTLYMIKPDPAQESWTGHQLSPAEATARSGIQNVKNVAEFGRLVSHVPKGGRLYLLNGDARQYPEEAGLRASLEATDPRLEILDPAPIFAGLRAIKSPWEIALMQHAVAISAEAHMRAWAMTEPGRWEYQIRAEFAAVFGTRHATWGYPEIVASGDNATTLHYETDQAQIPDHGLMLIDAAAEYGHMAADITRTFPINGKFTPAEAEIYNLVYAAQQAMIASVKPGSPDFNPIGNGILIAGLERLGLITTAPGAPPAFEQMRIWYFHGPSHPMGLDVHDVGGLERRPGVIMSMEPGLYFRPETFAQDLPTSDPAAWKVFTKEVEPVFEKYKGIGVRIEDDVLVTPDGHRVLSAAIPSRLTDVEARWAELHAYVQQHGGPPPLLP
jgi:Xaa-Pro aminopeptidase